MGVDKLLCLTGLVPTAAVVAFGAFTSISQPAYRVADRYDGELRYADGARAVLQTSTGLRLVTVGTSLPAAGQVKEIAKRDGHWTVATTAGILFVEN